MRLKVVLILTVILMISRFRLRVRRDEGEDDERDFSEKLFVDFLHPRTQAETAARQEVFSVCDYGIWGGTLQRKR